MLRGTPGLRGPIEDGQGYVPAGVCMRCAGEIYPGETVFVWEERRVCVDCFRAKVSALLNEAPGEVAQMLGVETKEV